MNTTPPEGPPQAPPTDPPAGSPGDTPQPSAAGAAHDPASGGPRVTKDEVRDLGRLRRSITDRKVAGVAGGLARHLDIDPVIVRVALVVLIFFGGAGLIVYGACWLLVPEEGRRSARLHLDDRSRSVALIVVGVLAAVSAVGDTWGAFRFPWPLAIVALVVLLMLNRRDRASGHREPAPTETTSAPPAHAPAIAQSTYEQPAYQPAYAQGAHPRAPRRRGPVLFWFTLALIALGIGVLGIFDLAGAPVADSAYPALAVGLSGLMLLVGAFYGRAGGLILLGLVSTMALAGASAADNWETTTVSERPTSAAQVADGYSFSTGEFVLDLSSVSDVAALDGRTIELNGDIGHLEVILPAGIETRMQASVHWVGSVDFFGRTNEGFDVTASRFHNGDPGTGDTTVATTSDTPTLVIAADLNLGHVEVHQ